MSDDARPGLATLPLDLAILVHKICHQFEAAWKTDHRPRLEDFLGEVSEADRLTLLRELVLLEITYRKRAGESPEPAEYLTRFPTLERASLTKEIAGNPEKVVAAPASADSTPTTGKDESDSSPATKIRCPHCQNPIQLGEKQSDEVLCPGCGGSFRLRDASYTDTASGMKTMGRFQLLERLGLGGFGAVWKTRDTELDRIVALKIPHTGLLTEKEELERFQREARAAAQLRHPNIVSVHEVATLNGLPVIVAEFVPGVPLKDFLDERPFTFRQAAILIAQVADALDYAHSLGVVHRDVKPANIMLLRGTTVLNPAGDAATEFATEISAIGKPMILDFGLALRSAGETTMTVDGHVLGTPAYMSPEQAAGHSHKADRRSDVYSLGVVLYQLLTGELPFRGSRLMMLDQVMREEPRQPRKVNDKIPRDLDTICLKCLRKEPAKRYASAAELADELRRHLRGEPILARPVGRLERSVKWVKRNPSVSTLMTVILLILVALSLATVLLTVSNESERQARGLAEAQSRRSKELLADMQTFSGIVAGEGGDPAQAALWFANAAGIAPHDKHRERTNRLRFTLWSRDLPQTTRAFAQNSDVPFQPFQAGGSPWQGSVVQFLPHPDGIHVLARAAVSNIWKLWNVPKEEAERLPHEEDKILAACWNSNGDLLALGTATGQCLVRSMPDLKPSFEVSVGSPVSEMVFSPDGRWLAVAHGKVVHIWDCKRAVMLAAPLQLSATVEWLVFNSKGTSLAVAAANGANNPGSVSIFRLDPSALPDDLAAVQLGVRPVVNWPREHDWFAHRPPVWLDQDQAFLTYTSADGISWWNAETGQLLRAIDTNLSLPGALVASPDGRFLAVGGWAGAQLFDAQSGKPVGPRMTHKSKVTSAAFSNDSGKLLTGSVDHTIRFWSVPSGQPLGPYHQLSNEVLAISFLGKGFLTGNQNDGVIRCWQPSRPTLPFRDYALPTGHYVDFASFVDEQGHYLLSMTPGESVQIIDLKRGKHVGQPLAKVGSLFLGAFVPRSSRAIIQSGASVRCWDWQTGEKIWGPLKLPSMAYSLAVSPDAGRVVAMCADRGIVLDTNTGHTLGEFIYERVPYMKDGKPYVRFSPDGSCFACFFAWTAVEVRNSSTSTLKFPPLEHGHRVDGIVFSQDSRYLATGCIGSTGTARVFDLTNGRELVKLEHPNWVREVAFYEDRRRLLTTCRDGSARVWDWQTGKLDSPRMTQEQNSWMYSALMLPHTPWVITSTDNAMQVWDSVLGKSVTPPLAMPRCRCLRLAADGRKLAAPTDSGFIRVYDLAPLLDHTADQMTEEQLALLAELQSLHKIGESGTLLSLTTNDWLERWHKLRRVFPGDTSRDDSEPPPDETDDNLRILAAFRRGKSELDAGNHDRAIADFSEAIRLYPEYVNAYIGRGVAWLRKDDYDKGIADCDEAIRLDPRSNVFASRAFGWIRKQDYDRAIADCDEAIRLNPKQALAFHNRGFAWSLKKDYDKAIADYNEATRLDPNYSLTYTNRVSIWRLKKDYDKAIADCSELIKLNPKNSKAYANRAYFWRLKEDYDNAIADCGEAIRLTPKDPALYINRGNAWRDKKDYDKAFADYNEAIRLDPKSSVAYYNRDDKVIFTPETDGIFRLASISTKPGATGAYTLKVREVVKSGPAQVFQEALTNGDKADKGKFFKLYKVELTAGKPCVLELESNVFDSFLILRFPADKQLAENDDIDPGNNTNSRIDFTPSASGTYTIVVTSFGPGQTGAFTLRVQGYEEPKGEGRK